MNIAILGATGGTGRHILEQAIATGHRVTAVVRRPHADSRFNERATVVRGNVLEPATLAQPLAGQDAVISAIGVNTRRPTTLYSEGTANILNAMWAAGVRRFLCISAAALEVGQGVPLLERMLIPLVVQRLLREPFADMVRMEACVRKSGLDWTIVRVPRLTDGPRTGKYRVAHNAHLSQWGVSRADVADCILKCIADPACYHSRIELAYAP